MPRCTPCGFSTTISNREVPCRSEAVEHADTGHGYGVVVGQGFAQGIKGSDPITNGQLTREEIARGDHPLEALARDEREEAQRLAAYE